MCEGSIADRSDIYSQAQEFSASPAPVALDDLRVTACAHRTIDVGFAKNPWAISVQTVGLLARLQVSFVLHFATRVCVLSISEGYRGAPPAWRFSNARIPGPFVRR